MAFQGFLYYNWMKHVTIQYIDIYIPLRYDFCGDSPNPNPPLSYILFAIMAILSGIADFRLTSSSLLFMGVSKNVSIVIG